MAEAVKDWLGRGMPLEVWKRLQEHFPGILHPAEPPDSGDPEYPTAEHRLRQAVSRSYLLNRPRYEGVLVHSRHLVRVLIFLVWWLTSGVGSPGII